MALAAIAAAAVMVALVAGDCHGGVGGDRTSLMVERDMMLSSVVMEWIPLTDILHLESGLHSYYLRLLL